MYRVECQSFCPLRNYFQMAKENLTEFLFLQGIRILIFQQKCYLKRPRNHTIWIEKRFVWRAWRIFGHQALANLYRKATYCWVAKQLSAQWIHLSDKTWTNEAVKFAIKISSFLMKQGKATEKGSFYSPRNTGRYKNFFIPTLITTENIKYNLDKNLEDLVCCLCCLRWH